MKPSRPRLALGVATLALLALLTVFAVELVDSQAKARRDVATRFSERAKVSAALTQALFTSSSQTGQASKQYGAAQVSARAMAAAAKQSSAAYLVLLDSAGHVISHSPSTSPSVLRAIAARPPYVRDALAGHPIALSDVQQLPSGAAVGFAQSFPTAFGRRVTVSGINTPLLSIFLGGYLAQVPNTAGGHAYLIDGNGAIIAATDATQAPGQTVREPGLLSALHNANHGSFADRYFAADPIRYSTWRVVVTAPSGALFASVNGPRKWVPWILLTGFGLVAVFALALLRRVLSAAAELHDANDQLGHANDQLERANDVLERRAAELARSNSELEQFASIASHDLQEPLRKVQTFGEQLTRREGDRLSEQGRDYLNRMSAAAQRMQTLIDDLLEFSRITTRVRPPELIDLAALAREVTGDLDTVIEETGATVEIGELPAVLADRIQMRQLLQNLVSNALKFHRDGIAEFSVSDDGIGFEPQYALRIFRVFERLHGRAVYPGTGIGLALCRRIAERHGGTIIADAQPGEGASFTITLPMEPTDAPVPMVVPGMSGEKEASVVSA
jgi:signal transduction histidine kinase